ncbi:hypothetical protein D9756_004667 [Leucocoprinus leucothites]|uniref:Homeobox domain-containing protein n=1 Tax=Leucocoprinus leucothites TaxID=201217 RepID=A0A8H5G991_9AGAR|nr:hypothetical protein D9756_004667 [Leucoagaricus leucothites]
MIEIISILINLALTMSAQPGPKPKPVPIRATPAQTALLKAAYAVSYNPSPKAIGELSRQTGLPGKWISSWFGRQRTKSRKNGEIIDLTTSSSVSTTSTLDTLGGATPAQSSPKVEEAASEAFDVLMADRLSSPPMPAKEIAPVTAKAKAAKAPRKRPARTSKAKPKPKPVVKSEPRETPLPAAAMSSIPNQGRPPQLLPLAASSYDRQSLQGVIQPPLAIPPPTRSGMASRPQTARIYSQNTTDNVTAQSSVPEVYSSTGYFSVPLRDDAQPTTAFRKNGPIFRNEFRHSVPSDYYSDPVSADAASPYQKDLDLDSQRASSPVQPPEYSASDFAPAQSTSNSASALVPPFVPLTAQAISPDQQSLWNLHSQAVAGYMAMYNNNPGVYRAMLLNYAALFPALLPAINGALGRPVSGSHVPAASPLTSADFSTAGRSPFDSKVPPPSSSPILPSISVDDDTVEVPLRPSNYHSMAKQETQETPWNSSDDYLDFSSLHYDYAPLSHLQERLEPFRLPESAYLFGRREWSITCWTNDSV